MTAMSEGSQLTTNGDWAWRHGERTLRVTLYAKMVFFVPNFD